MPLFVPANLDAIQIARLNQRTIFFKLTGVNNANAAANTQPREFSFFENGEMIVGGDDNKIGFMNDMRQSKIEIFPSFPDFAAGFSIGNIITPFRSVKNHGAGDEGSIFCVTDSAEIARSNDNGVSWVDVTPPSFVGDTIRGIVEMSNGRLYAQKSDAGVDIAFSDNGGATWTDDGDVGSAVSRAPIMARDRSRVCFFSNSTEFFLWTKSQAGAPSYTAVSLTAETGQTFGPGPMSVFDNSGGCLLLGDFGEFTYTAGFSAYSLILDIDNPMIKGDQVGSTTFMSAGYHPDLDAFIVLSTATNANPGVACLFPRATITDPSTYTVISLDRSIDGNAIPLGGEGDGAGNFIVASTDDNVVWQSLLSSIL